MGVCPAGSRATRSSKQATRSSKPLSRPQPTQPLVTPSYASGRHGNRLPRPSGRPERARRPVGGLAVENIREQSADWTACRDGYVFGGASHSSTVSRTTGCGITAGTTFCHPAKHPEGSQATESLDNQARQRHLSRRPHGCHEVGQVPKELLTCTADLRRQRLPVPVTATAIPLQTHSAAPLRGALQQIRGLWVRQAERS